MKRKVITIDESKCNGCGNCITACAEGALQLVDGKARLVKEQFCDGFGDCLGDCPTGALKIEERDSDAFDVEATRRHLLQTAGPEAVARMDTAARKHAAVHASAPSGCPGSRARDPRRGKDAAAATPSGTAATAQAIRSELEQWPIQLHLVQPGAAFFANRELVVLSTCSPVASPDVHWRFVRGRGLVVACPKLDRTEGYVEKLAGILSDPSIPKAIVVRMEVPCCGGLTAIATQAAARCGRKDLILEEVTVALNGDIVGTRTIAAAA